MTFSRLQPRAPDKEPIEPLVRAEGDSLYADRDRLCLAHHHSSSSDSSRAQAFKSRRTAATPGSGARSAESNSPRLSGRAAAERYRARPDPLAQVAPPDASFGDPASVAVQPYAPASLCRPGLSRALMVVGGSPVSGGGAWARWRDGVCPRTPRLTSVLDAGWLPVGYMMWWGVPADGVRPLSLTGPFPVRGRQRGGGSWPRFIG